MTEGSEGISLGWNCNSSVKGVESGLRSKKIVGIKRVLLTKW